MAKVLDVTTKGWSKENLDKMKVILKKSKYQVDILTKEGTSKFMYVDNPEMVKPYCKQTGAKILKVTYLEDEN